MAERPPLRPARPAWAVPAGARDLVTGSPDVALLPSLAGALHAIEAPHRNYGGEPMLPELAAVAGAALAADGVPGGRLCVVNGALDGIERVLAAHLSPGDVRRGRGSRLAGRARPRSRARPAPRRRRRRRARDAAARAGGRAGRGRARRRAHAARPQPAAARPWTPSGRADLRSVLSDAVLVVEDDHLGPVAGTPWHTLVEPGRERWAAVRSVSKWLGPDLRLAVLAGDETTLARVEGRQSLGPGWVSGIVQRLVARLWSDDAVMAVVARASSVYAERRAALASLLGLPVPPSGINLWVPVDDEDSAVGALLAEG